MAAWLIWWPACWSVDPIAEQLTLKSAVTALAGAISSLDASNPFHALKLDTAYASGPGGDLLVYVAATLDPTALAPVQVPLSLGSRLSGLGIALDADPDTPGVQAPTFSITSTIAANLAVGVDMTTLIGTTPSAAFLKDGGHVDLSVNATLDPLNVGVSLGLLSATVSSTQTIELKASLKLKFEDPNAGKVTAAFKHLVDACMRQLTKVKP